MKNSSLERCAHCGINNFSFPAGKHFNVQFNKTGSEASTLAASKQKKPLNKKSNMKKFLALFALVAFVGVLANAQSPTTSTEKAKTECSKEKACCKSGDKASAACCAKDGKASTTSAATTATPATKVSTTSTGKDSKSCSSSCTKDGKTGSCCAKDGVKTEGAKAEIKTPAVKTSTGTVKPAATTVNKTRTASLAQKDGK